MDINPKAWINHEFLTLKTGQNIQENLLCEVDLLWILHVKASKKYAGRTSTCTFSHIEHITWHSAVREEETKCVQYNCKKISSLHTKNYDKKNPEHDKHILYKMNKFLFIVVQLFKNKWCKDYLYTFSKLKNYQNCLHFREATGSKKVQN